MKTSIHWYGILLFTLIIGVSGCAANTKVVTDAGLYFNLVKAPIPDGECKYSDVNKKTACEQLVIAEEALREGREAEAVSAAEKSIEASKKLFHENIE